MTLYITENGELDIHRDELQDEIWIVVVTIRSRVDGYTMRKMQTLSFLTEDAARRFHAEYGYVWEDLDFEILNVDYVRYAQVPF